MKIFPSPLIYVFILIGVFGKSFSQDTESLVQKYSELQASPEKAKLADSLFILLRKSDLPLAIKYVREGLTISRAIDYREGEVLALLNLGKFHGRERQIDSIRFYYKQATELYENLGKAGELFDALHTWVRHENLEGQFENALELSDRSLDVAGNLNDGVKLSDAYQRRATIYLDQGEYRSAIEELVSAARILDTIQPPEPVKKAIVLVGIGRTEMFLNNYDLALEKMGEGLEVFIEKEEEMWQAITYLEIGSVHYDLRNWPQSIENYHMALEISRKNERDDFIAAILGNLGGVYIEQKEYDKALTNLFESNKIALKRGSVTNQIITYNDIATAYYGKKEYPKAIENYSEAIKLADSIQSLDVLSDAYEERARVYEEMGNHKSALEDQKNFQIVHDSVYNIAKSNQIEELKTRYETEKKEQQIALQESEIALLEEKQRAATLQNILLILGILAISAVFGLTYYGLRQRMKRNRAVREKLDSELAFKKKELTTHALHLAKKNEVLESIKQKANELRLAENNNGYKELIRTINFDQQDDKSWENFTQYFEQVHKDFAKTVKLRYPDITKNELRLMALLKMNLSSKEIATILNISQEGIKKARYRLRKKLDISSEESLQDMVLSL
ncbi:MAG: tetratricopeptide repeat protein [Flavobacteriaceae bacterium]